MSPLQHTLLSNSQLQPRNRTAFFISGCPLRGECLVTVSCSKLKHEGYDNHMDVVQSLSSDFTEMKSCINKDYDKKHLTTFFNNGNKIKYMYWQYVLQFQVMFNDQQASVAYIVSSFLQKFMDSIQLQCH